MFAPISLLAYLDPCTLGCCTHPVAAKNKANIEFYKQVYDDYYPTVTGWGAVCSLYPSLWGTQLYALHLLHPTRGFPKKEAGHKI